MKIKSMTADDVLKANNGFTSGFDYLRISLAILIMVVHSVSTTYGAADQAIWGTWLRPIPAMLVPMFFCLSGFLVAGSIARTRNVSEFLMLRVIRIVPALFVEVILCAILIGSFFTTLPLEEYFTSDGFHDYFLNILGIVHLQLPGLFTSNPMAGIVNMNLWTLPYELYCYIILAVLILLKAPQKPLLFFVSVLALIIINHFPTYETLQGLAIFRPTGRTLVIAFLAGVACYLIKDKLVINHQAFAISTVAGYFLLLDSGTQVLAIIPLAYMTVYLGLATPPKKGFLFRGDYSYGLYLFGFPLQQLYVMLVPEDKSVIGNMAFSLSLGLCYAYFSWHCVEKPILLRKKQIIDTCGNSYSKIRNSLRG